MRAADMRPVGIRVHLSADLLVPRAGQLIDVLYGPEPTFTQIDLSERAEPFVLEPGTFVLASTIERLRTSPDIVCLLEGRSTLARLGITIHNTAATLDGTYHDWLRPTLEITNHGNLRLILHFGMPIGMFCFHSLSSPATSATIRQQYLGQLQTTPPRLCSGARARPSQTTRSPDRRLTGRETPPIEQDSV